MELTEKEKVARERVCLALNTMNPNLALKWTEESEDLVGYRKAENDLLFGSIFYGINIMEKLSRRGKVFADSKIYSTNEAAQRTARAITSLGTVDMFNVHLEGGAEMCCDARNGIEFEFERLEKIHKGYFKRPKILGVTVLSTEPRNENLVMKRTELAREWGLDGVVAPAFMGGKLEREFGADLMYVLTGIEFDGRYGSGQINHYSLAQSASESKNSIFVVGGAFTSSPNMRETIYKAVKVIAKSIPS